MSVDKKVYKVQEALVLTAAVSLYGKSLVHLRPSRHAGPLRPDVVVGSPMRPSVVYLVTHGGAQNARQMKVWRDLYELASYRTMLPSTRVIRVYFGSGELDGWDRVLRRAFDATVYFHVQPDLARRMEELAELSQGDILERLDSEPWRTQTDALARQLASSTDGRQDTSPIRLPGGGRSLYAHEPSMLRRAVAILGLSGHREARDFLMSAGIISSSIAGEVWAEPYRWWVQDARAILGNHLGWVRSRASEILREDAHHLAHLPVYLEAMRRCAVRPSECRTTPHLVLLGIRYTHKALSLHSFSNARMVRAMGRRAGTSDLYSMSRIFLGRLSLPESLASELPRMAGQALELVHSSVNEVEFRARLFKAVLRDSAMKRRHLDPLGWLVNRILPDGELRGRHPSVLDPNGRIATTRLYLYDGNGIHWRTAHMGRRDKAKELAARGASLRSLVKRLVILLDGEWGASEIRMLHEGGWDTVPVWYWRSLPDLLS